PPGTAFARTRRRISAPLIARVGGRRRRRPRFRAIAAPRAVGWAATLPPARHASVTATEPAFLETPSAAPMAAAIGMSSARGTRRFSVQTNARVRQGRPIPPPRRPPIRRPHPQPRRRRARRRTRCRCSAVAHLGELVARVVRPNVRWWKEHSVKVPPAYLP